ncbi:MAG: hypothetical protein E6H07_02865 [Bacteroidetes bacterium]|nr:MAG: hypothetical protein E6H07_02865 [Bacteroidota bacterium]
MKSITRHILTYSAFFLLANSLPAQTIDTLKLKLFKPPHERVLFHEQVVTEQKNMLKYDGIADFKLEVSDNPEINYMVTRSARWEIRDLLYKIEKDSTLNHNNKVRYLRGMREYLQDILKGWRSRDYNPVSLPNQIAAYWQCMQLNKKGTTIEHYFNELEWEVAAPLTKTIAFENNAGLAKCKEILVLKYCTLYPDRIFKILTEYPGVWFADSLIRTVARKRVDELYDYAAANNKLGTVIRNIDDPFIKTVSKMARSKSGRLYFPFLDNIVNGKITFEELDAVTSDSIAYYKLMVKTQMDYVSRAINKDTAFGFKDLTVMLQKKAETVFINTINGLHEVDNPAVRFAIIQQLNAQELYYATVLTDGVIYTSSYTKGVYPLMMQRINQKGDSLLELVKFDKYRRFIKMAAGYNTLDNFLSTFSKTETDDKAKVLMRAFVSNLEKTGELEDGVDVADSYASIAETLKPVADEMLQNIKLNYKRNADRFARTNDPSNMHGMNIYNILEKLFLSADTTQKIDLTAELGIPPVYEVTNKALQNDSGRIIMQVFFYGEKSDMGIFNSSVGYFRRNGWKVSMNDYWMTATSLKGKPITVYANRALPQETSEDEAAQKALCEYLVKNKIKPTITIHRGHSYTAPSTIEQMFPSSKIVFLGSCGGYHLIHDVLVKAEDAHIMASKQIGMGRINQPFTDLILEELQAGKDIEWIPFWKKFRARTGNADGFEDYIPPYKNLGALYIKAYKIAENKSERKFVTNSLSGN